MKVSKPFHSIRVLSRHLHSDLSKSNSKLTIQQTINNKTQQYEISDTDKKLKSVSQSNESQNILSLSNGKELIHNIGKHCLPKGYPHSVSAGYDKFMYGQMASAVVSSAGGVLSMQALLYAMGLGSSSIPLAATLNWILKDGLGQLGGILFASLVNTKFDADPKKWRIIAAVALEISNFIEMTIPYFNAYFLPLAAFANIGKNISALATSASRAAIHKSFAKEENLADITAKTASQNILASTVGTSLGISIATIAQQSYELTFAAFSILSISSLFCSHYSLQYVTINTLSLIKLESMFVKFLQNSNNVTAQDTQSPIHHLSSSWIIEPKTFKDQENLMFQLPPPQYHLDHRTVQFCDYQVGSSISSAFGDCPKPDFEELLNLLQDRKYLLSAKTIDLNNSQKKLATVHILLHEDATTRDLLLGIAHGHVVRYLLAQEGYVMTDKKHVESLSSSSNNNAVLRLDVVKQSMNLIHPSPSGSRPYNIDHFVDELLANTDWHIGNGILESQYARYSFANEGKE